MERLSAQHLRRQGDTWHARLTIPQDVRHKFGSRREFWLSLETASLKLAQVRKYEVIAGWKREIQLARDGVNVGEWAKSWAKEYKEATDIQPSEPESSDSEEDTLQPSQRDIVSVLMTDELEHLVSTGDMTLPEAKEAFEVATGKRILLSDYRDDFLAQYRNNSPKTQGAYSAALDHFLDHFEQSTEVAPKAVRGWLDHLVEEKDLGQETISRALRQAQAYRRYLVDHEILPRE